MCSSPSGVLHSWVLREKGCGDAPSARSHNRHHRVTFTFRGWLTRTSQSRFPCLWVLYIWPWFTRCPFVISPHPPRASSASLSRCGSQHSTHHPNQVYISLHLSCSSLLTLQFGAWKQKENKSVDVIKVKALAEISSVYNIADVCQGAQGSRHLLLSELKDKFKRWHL